MIDLEFLESLIRAIDESSIDSVEIERGGTRIRVSKTPEGGSEGGGGAMPAVYAANPHPGTAAPPQATPAPGAQEAGTPSGGSGSAAAESPEAEAGAGAGEPAVEEAGTTDVTSPMVGTFYRAPAPDAPPYVEVGDRIAKGDTLCIIEAMKLMNELECEEAGTIAEICVENAEPVEYGQVLFRIEPA